MNIPLHLKRITFIFFFSLLLLQQNTKAQELTFITQLSPSLSESSGILCFEEHILTQNDSGGEAILYELSPDEGTIVRTIKISNATNVDWEDLSQDENNIYVADIGNNAGARRDQRIYKIAKADLLNGSDLEVNTASIRISYKDQTNFEAAYLQTRYDAEALISYKEYLYIFTKNWLTRWTNIYRVPKTPGDYSLEKIDSIRVPGVITSGTFNKEYNTILLTGYNQDSAFITEITGFRDSIFSQGDVNHIFLELPQNSSRQIEAVCYKEANSYFLSSESNEDGAASLYELKIGKVVSQNSPIHPSKRLFINHQTKMIQASSLNSYFTLYNTHGKLIKQSEHGRLRTHDIARGFYILKAEDDTESWTQKCFLHP